MGLRQLEIYPNVTITNDRCLLIGDGPTAVIGDLHLGYESSLEEEGFFIPRVNAKSIRQELNRIIDEYEPQRMVLLGDIKHDFRRSSFKAQDEVREIIKLISDATETIVVRGNHDNYLQNILSDLGLTALDYIDVEGFRLEHGHVDSGKRPVIIGHEHPSVRIPGAMSRGLKLQCYVVAKEEGVIVIPPFSPFASGNDINMGEDAVIAKALKSCDLSKAEIYGVSETGLISFGALDDISMLTI